MAASPATSVGSQQSSTSRSGEGGSTQGANHLVSSSKKAKNKISPLMVAMATTAADAGSAHLLFVRRHPRLAAPVASWRLMQQHPPPWLSMASPPPPSSAWPCPPGRTHHHPPQPAHHRGDAGAAGSGRRSAGPAGDGGWRRRWWRRRLGAALVAAAAGCGRARMGEVAGGASLRLRWLAVAVGGRWWRQLAVAGRRALGRGEER
jgi:hypothetical protein